MAKGKFTLDDGTQVIVRNPEMIDDSLPSLIRDTDVVRVRISMAMPDDLLKAYKEAAKKLHRPYQTLIQEILRNHIPGGENDIEKRLERIEKLLKKKVG